MATKAAEDTSFLEDFEGQGLESITANEQAIPYLGMVQPDGTAAADGATPGVWRNSATGEEYGNAVTVVPLAFRTIWNERESEPPFNTVGRYAPHSIEVTVQQPKGGKGYPKMINPESGNEVQELYIYAVMLPEHPEAGVLLFNPTVGSMRTCKSWNTQLKSQLLPNGAQAPIFAYSWDLAADLVDNPAKKGAKMAKFVKVQRSSVISKELFEGHVKPQLPAIQQTVLSITADAGTEEGAE
jgi:hypothetical protein